MGHCLREQIYRMSGLANKVLCGYRLPVALWTCKAKWPIIPKAPPLWAEPWSLAKQPHGWTSNWALTVCLLADTPKLKFMMPIAEAERPSPLAFSKSPKILEMPARAPEHQQRGQETVIWVISLTILEELRVFLVAIGFFMYSFWFSEVEVPDARIPSTHVQLY